MNIKISNISNLKIRKVLKLQKKFKERISNNLFVIEGTKEVKMALDSNYIFKEVFICKEIFKNKYLLPNSIQIIEISLKIFKKLSYRKTTGGIIAICQRKYIYLENLILSKTPLLLILDKIEKPGNIGAIIRTAEAAKIDAVILSDSKTDLFNPNVIRCSIGTIFTMTVISEKSKKIISWLKKKKIQILSMSLDKNSKNIYKYNIKSSIAIIIGSENKGLSNNWIKISDKKIQIPMKGKIDSLNLSNAAAIAIFEIIRQRYYNIS